MTTQQKLMSRIAKKEIFTPYEAVFIQYLNKKYKSQQMPDISADTNIYTSTDNINSLYSSPNLKQILSFNTLQEAQEYDALRWAANLLSNYDKASLEIAYKATAEMNELRYFRDESLIKILMNKDQPVQEPLENFTAFSHLHQKLMTFQEVTGSLILTLQILIMTVDNVLSLNHFLNGMIESPDLLCLNNLRKILIVHEEDQNNDAQLMTPFSLIGIDREKLFNTVIDTNHPRFVQHMKTNLSLFSWRISPNFEKDSIDFVKKTIKEVIG